jgi:hypothetical protein
MGSGSIVLTTDDKAMLIGKTEGEATWVTCFDSTIILQLILR